MILLMDAGNTNIKIGLDNGVETLYTWRVATDYSKTADEYGMIIYDLLTQNGYKLCDIEGIIISSVVPSINYTLDHMCDYYWKMKPIMVSPKIELGMKINYHKPEDLGADRIINAVAAFKEYGGPAITIDFGSATTFGVISSEGDFEGGAIAPGIKSSTEALVRTGSKLPRIELVKPKSVIGANTVQNMQAGVIYGFTGMVEYIVKTIKTENGYANAKVIATGGLSMLIDQKVAGIDVIDRSLSLKGLKYLYDMNKRK
ncbi:MAG: type III pantothenate kinase [Clostridia bacterium]|nr:type III pantothenate kinase [Clostridia bacterium]